MIDLQQFLCGFSAVISQLIVLYFLQGLVKIMALILTSPTSCALTRPPSCVGRKGGSLLFESLNIESPESSAFPREEENFPRVTCHEENTLEENIGGVDATGFCGEKEHEKSGILMIDKVSHEERIMQDNLRNKVHQKGVNTMNDKCTQEINSGVLLIDQGISDYSLEMVDFGGAKGAPKLRKRPSMLVVPAFSADEMEFGEMGRKLANKEFEVEGKNFVLASKKGRRTTVMEDGYGVMLDILGDPKQVRLRCR